MSFSCGIVGLPNVGKSTLFNALTLGCVTASNFPFCTIEPNVGVVNVPDERLKKIVELLNPEQATPTTIKFVDIAGLVKDASKGEGLGNLFLSHIRNVDLICHVIRAFKDENVSHMHGTASPIKDAEIVNLELIIADVDSVTKKIEKTKTVMKSGDKKFIPILAFYEKLLAHLQSGKPARILAINNDEKPLIGELFLLTLKPVVYVVNVDETEINKKNDEIENFAKGENAKVCYISSKIEEEIRKLENETERQELFTSYGIKETAVNELIKVCYETLKLVTFYTTKGPELRAWTLEKGQTVYEAAGKIHTDIQQGFIKAEIINFNELTLQGSMKNAHDKGLVKIEGKEYIVKDGDVILIKFK